MIKLVRESIGATEAVRSFSRRDVIKPCASSEILHAKQLSIGLELQAGDRIGTHDVEHFLPGVRLPDPHRARFITGRQQLAVGRERGPPHNDVFPVGRIQLLEVASHSPGRDIPEP